MRESYLSGRYEFSVWGNIDTATNEEAKALRNAKAKELRARGCKVRQWVLRNQLRQYAGFGQPDGRVGHVYYVTVLDTNS